MCVRYMFDICLICLLLFVSEVGGVSSTVKWSEFVCVRLLVVVVPRCFLINAPRALRKRVEICSMFCGVLRAANDLWSTMLGF